MPINLKWLALAPLSWLVGGWMFAASFESTGPVPVLTNAYNNRTESVSFGVPNTAKMILQFGGAAIAIGGTAIGTFFALSNLTQQSRKPPLKQILKSQQPQQPQLNQPRQLDDLPHPPSIPSQQPQQRSPLPTTNNTPDIDLWTPDISLSRSPSVSRNTTVSDSVSDLEFGKVSEFEFDSEVDEGEELRVQTSDKTSDKTSSIVLSGYGNKQPKKPDENQSNILEQAALYGCGVNPNNIKGHLLIPAITQSGKTSTLCGLIREVSRICPQVIWNGVDPKGSVFLGLERLCHPDGFPVIVTVELDEPRAGIANTIKLLQRAISEQTRRKKLRQKARQTGQSYNPTPYIIILDEWPILLKLAKDCESKDRQTLIQLAETLAFAGLEDNLILWIVAQSPYVKQLGFDTSVAAQFTTLAIGRGFKSTSIELCKESINRSLSNKVQKTKLFQQLDQLAEANPYNPIYFFSTGNQIAYAPDLKNIQEQQLFQSDNQEDIKDSIRHFMSLTSPEFTPSPESTPEDLSKQFTQFVKKYHPKSDNDEV